MNVLLLCCDLPVLLEPIYVLADSSLDVDFCEYLLVELVAIVGVLDQWVDPAESKPLHTRLATKSRRLR